MYRTSQEENEILTRVSAGTPMGELLRRYWWPIGISAHLKEKPTYIRVLGEDLVLFRDSAGQPAIIGAKCAHRRANLCLGNVEKDGLNALADAGLTLRHMDEPAPPPGFLARAAEYEAAATIPRLLFLHCEKQGPS